MIFWPVLTLLVGFGVAFFLFRKSSSEQNNLAERQMGEAFRLLQNQMSSLTSAIDQKIHQQSAEMQNTVRSQFSASQELIKEVTARLTEVKEGSAQVLSVGEQFKNLEKILKHQKQRGAMGEASLELILANILPPGAYKTQYRFGNGEVVDAIIETKEGIIPIDAKYSLDNYERILQEEDETRRMALEVEFRNDLKKRIDETSKYIRPEENTLPFAFMFIPAEGIYYDLLINEVGAVKVNTRNLIDYAYHEKKVIIVSPTTFYAYLSSVLYGFKAFKVSEDAKEIMKRVGELGKHLSAYESYFKKMGAALSTTVNHYNSASKELKKVDKDVLKISGVASGIESEMIDRPRGDEE